MSEQTIFTPQVQVLTNLFAKRVTKSAKKGAVNEVQLAKQIGEIEIETQINGASFLKVHIIDPEWELATSGWLNVKEGLIEPVELEFPEKSKWIWTICAVEISTDVTEPNLIVTFEDRVVAYLRSYWGTKFAPAGTQTRAEFIRTLIDQVGSRGEERIKFVCPSVGVIQEVETNEEEESKKVKTTEADEEAFQKANKASGIVPASEITVKKERPNSTQYKAINVALKTAKRLSAPPAAVEALIIAGIGESNFNPESSNASGHNGVWQSDTIPGNEVEKQAEFFLKGGESFQGGGAIKLAHEGKKPGEIATTVEASGEAPSFYEQYLPEAKQIIAKSGGVNSVAEESKSDVGQLQRGTSANPDEDSWECCTRLAQQVDWYFFSNMDYVYYMEKNDLMRQVPELYIDIPKNHVHGPKEHGNQGEYGVIFAPTTVTFDNTTYEYRQTHKQKARVQRKSKTVRPASPSEIKLLLECPITAYRAGDAFMVQNSGPANGVWIVTDSKRNCLKDTFTEFILEPPIEPLPEPKEETSGVQTLSENTPGTALTAFEDSSTLSSWEIPYKYGGGHGTNDLAQVGKGYPNLDCSSSTCWVLKEAGMFPSNTAEDSTELEKWGEPGQGHEMTVWANAEHVFIEFNISGHERAQLQTAGRQNGPRLYTVTKEPTQNMNPQNEGFTPRHWKGT